LLLTDDAVIKRSFRCNLILEYFYNNCCPAKDVLPISDDSNVKTLREITRSTDNGLIFSPLLVDIIKFRDDLIMGQFDLLFSDDIHRNNGKIFLFPETILTVRPIGRAENNNHYFLPTWRNYLLVRNTISLWLERRNQLIEDVLAQNYVWFTKANVAREKWDENTSILGQLFWA
jgi:hypothetical protein